MMSLTIMWRVVEDWSYKNYIFGIIQYNQKKVFAIELFDWMDVMICAWMVVIIIIIVRMGFHVEHSFEIAIVAVGHWYESCHKKEWYMILREDQLKDCLSFSTNALEAFSHGLDRCQFVNHLYHGKPPCR